MKRRMREIGKCQYCLLHGNDAGAEQLYRFTALWLTLEKTGGFNGILVKYRALSILEFPCRAK